jgi:hypothetical protein
MNLDTPLKIQPKDDLDLFFLFPQVINTASVANSVDELIKPIDF